MMKKIISLFWIALCCFYPISKSYAAIGFAAERNGGDIYSFDPDNLSTPATLIFSPLTGVDIITVSPDGTTAYYTDGVGEVYSFPTQGPYVPTLVASGMPGAVGVAVTSDGSTLYIASDSPANIYTVSATGGPVTTLTSTGATIQDPLFVAITGNTAFIGDFSFGNIFSFPITPSQTTYNATLLQSQPGNVGGLAISVDGFLYWSTGFGGESVGNWIYRVPLSSPTNLPILVGTGPAAPVDGLCVSCDGTTVFTTNLNSGVVAGIWSTPTNQGLPAAATKLNGLGIPGAISVAIGGCPPITPTGIIGVQKKCDFGLVYEWCNILKWSPNPNFSNVVFYRIFRNGVQIATVNADTFTYKDHDRKKGVTTQYTVTAVIPGAEIPIGSVTIQ